MKKLVFFILISTSIYSQDFNFQRSWGTYFGNESFYLSDSKTDQLGNLYIAGYVSIEIQNNDFPILFNTQNSHQPAYGGGISDGFIAKFNPQGQLLWASYFGGENEDKLVSITVDSSNNVYIFGYTNSVTNIATPNCYQPSIAGNHDFILARLFPNGSVDWSTYYGGSNEEVDIIGNNDSSGKRMFITHDSLDNFYISSYSFSEGMATVGVFQENQQESQCIISKFNDAGNKLWTTYYGIYKNYINAIEVSDNALYVRGRSIQLNNVDFPNNTYYGTVGSFQSTPTFGFSTYLSKFNLEGQRLWSTYYGNLSDTSSNSIKVIQNNVYMSGKSQNSLVTTPGAFQETANNFTGYLVKFDSEGRRIWGTYNGFSNNSSSSNNYGTKSASCSKDESGNIYLSGTTDQPINIATTGAYQENFIGNNMKGYVSKFDANGQKNWGTYYGGNGQELEMICHPYNNNFYLVGKTKSTSGMTTQNSYQPNYLLSNLNNNSQNIFIAHFEPNNLTISKNTLDYLQLYPNPNSGNFSIKGNFSGLQNLEMIIYDNQGRIIYTKKIIGLEDSTTITLENKLQSGVYFVKIFNTDVEKTIKMMVR